MNALDAGRDRVRVLMEHAVDVCDEGEELFCHLPREGATERCVDAADALGALLAPEPYDAERRA